MFANIAASATKCAKQLKPYQERFGFELEILDVDEDTCLGRKNIMNLSLFCWMAKQKFAIGFWMRKN